jgi:glutathione S-transferase
MLLATQGQLEARLQERGGQFMVGNRFTWADLHLFFFCSEDFLDSKVSIVSRKPSLITDLQIRWLLASH